MRPNTHLAIVGREPDSDRHAPPSSLQQPQNCLRTTQGYFRFPCRPIFLAFPAASRYNQCVRLGDKCLPAASRLSSEQNSLFDNSHFGPQARA